MKKLGMLQMVVCIGLAFLTIAIIPAPPAKAPGIDCGPGACKPDLIPVWDVSGYCPYSYDEQHHIMYFRIKNIGNADANYFYNKMHDNAGDSVNVYVSLISPSQTVRLSAYMPNAESATMWDSYADIYDTVAEWDETNNGMSSNFICI
jgi:hypothetical protein